MTEEAQRIAIAEACGWTDIEGGTGFPPGPSFRYADNLLRLPNYPSDLNACHEMEKVLRNDQFHYTAYWRSLFKVVAGKKWTGDIGYFYFDLIHATAAQRCEAFLRTLNLWTK